MANQITINIGAAANDGTGDPLRTAFNDVNLNFANVWNTGLPNSNIQFSDNRILTVNTNANLVLAPNGIGKVASNVDIVPNTSNVLMLGSTTRRWNQIYTQYIDASANFNLSGDLTVGGNLTVTGNIIEMGNIVTDALTLQLANTASNATAANGSGITVGANDNIATLLYNSTSNIWTTNIGISAVGNISAPYFIGNGSQLTGITSYANANAVAYGQAGWAGNIIPSGNAVYSLGNATNQWKSLYVSNTTIYINNVPISLTAGNVLTVDGNDVVTTTANGQTSLGNLSVDDNNIYNTNGQGVVISNFSFIAEAETAYVQIPAGNSASDLSVVQKQGNVRLAANTADWTFDTTGNLTIPNGGYINFVNTGGITQAVNEDLRFTVSDDEQDGWAIQSTVNDGAGTDLTRMQVRYDGVRINTDLPTNNYNWDFRDTGEFDVPKSIRGPVGGNLVVSIGDQFGSTTFIDLQTRSYVGDALISNVRIANPNVTVSTSSGAYNWTFGGTGNLTLPLSGNIVGATANNNGYLNWFGNSSGDGGGYTTLRLVPDDTRESADQYLIIDPTAPGHIHIRAGGTQDNSNADLFLGGENSYFKVNAGANNEVRIAANSHAWVFGADSILTVPGEGVIRSIQDTVILQSYDISGNTYSARLGTTGGLYFETTAYPLGWLNLTNNSGDANISSPGGSINIDAANGTSGAAGKDINITAGDADQSAYYTTAGGDVNIQGGMGASNDGGGGGPGGDINLVAGTSADPAGHAGNITITSGSWNWQFINNGNLYVPGQINGDNNGALIIDGAGYGNGYISLPAGSFGGEQVAIVNDFSLGNGIALTTNGGTWHFGNSGNLTLPGNTFAVNYANGTQVSIGGGGSGYGDSNVATLLAAYGSNTISTSGNITAGNLIGNISITGNVTGTSSNVSLVAGSYTWTFDNTGNLALPGNSFTVNYANGTAVSLGGSYGNANLANIGSNTISTTGNISSGNLLVSGLISATGNITGGNLITSGSFQSANIVSTGNITSGNGFHVILGNANSALRQNGSNANVQLSGSVTLNPDTAASALNGVRVGGNGYLLATSGARVLTLNTDNSLTVAGNLTLGGSTSFSRFTTLGETTTGVNAIVAGQSPTILANSSATFTANVNNYTQITFQNKSTGTDATADFILTADNGSDTVNYSDFGIINSGYDNATPTNSLGNIVFAADTYVYAQGNVSNTSQSGGNLVIGTTTATKNVKIFAGGNTASALVANISNIGVSQPNLPGFRVTGNGNTVNLGNTINSTGNLNINNFAVDYNQGSYLNTSTGVFTAPIAGLYSVHLVARVSGLNNATSQMAVQKNGAGQIAFWEASANCTAAHFGVSSVTKLAVGDTLNLKVVLGNINFDGNDNWSVAFIG